ALRAGEVLCRKDRRGAAPDLRQCRADLDLRHRAGARRPRRLASLHPVGRIAMPIPGFVATIFYLFGGLVIWTARFLAAYGFTGLYCARPDWPDEVAGIGLLTLVVGFLSVAAL